PYVFLQTAKLLYDRGNQNEAYQYGTKALNLALKNINEIQKVVKTKLERSENLSEMESRQEKAALVKKNNEYARNSFQFITKKFSKQQILPELQSLMKMYPKSGRLIFMTADYYLNNGMNQQGVELLKKSVRINPNLAEAHIRLGDSY